MGFRLKHTNWTSKLRLSQRSGRRTMWITRPAVGHPRSVGYLQSAYKRFHSTETALLKIHNDIVDDMDSSKVTALTLLDLSAAFDTTDQLIVLQRLHTHFGISGAALRWFKSYFSDRHQSINISGTLSRPQHLPFGVRRGSVHVAQPSHY